MQLMRGRGRISIELEKVSCAVRRALFVAGGLVFSAVLGGCGGSDTNEALLVAQMMADEEATLYFVDLDNAQAMVFDDKALRAEPLPESFFATGGGHPVLNLTGSADYSTLWIEVFDETKRQQFVRSGDGENTVKLTSGDGCLAADPDNPTGVSVLNFEDRAFGDRLDLAGLAATRAVVDTERRDTADELAPQIFCEIRTSASVGYVFWSEWRDAPDRLGFDSVLVMDTPNGRFRRGREGCIWRPMALHPSEERLAVEIDCDVPGEHVNGLYLWDLQANGEGEMMLAHRGRFGSVEFSPSGELLAVSVAESEDSAHIEVVVVETGAVLEIPDSINTASHPGWVLDDRS